MRMSSEHRQRAFSKVQSQAAPFAILHALSLGARVPLSICGVLCYKNEEISHHPKAEFNSAGFSSFLSLT